MNLKVVAITDVGKVRQNNEDNFYVQGKIRQDLALLRSRAEYAGSDGQSLFAVADGMGGESNGELASLVCVQSLRKASMENVVEEATECIFDANEMLCDEMENIGKRMGSTLAALYIDDGKVMACNIGDSRIYMMRKGLLQQISVDHTIVQEMINNGVINKEEARTHKRRHVLSQNIGIFPDEMIIEPYFSPVIELVSGDIFLLCSDGLTDMVDDDCIEYIIKNTENYADALVETALENGGRDNVTVVVVEVAG